MLHIARSFNLRHNTNTLLLLHAPNKATV